MTEPVTPAKARNAAIRTYEHWLTLVSKEEAFDHALAEYLIITGNLPPAPAPTTTSNLVGWRMNVHFSDFAAFSRRLSSFSTASRMNSARRFLPTSASMRSGISSGRRTRIGFTFIGGLPMRFGVSDIGKVVNSTSINSIKRYRLLTLYPISVITSITHKVGAKKMANMKYFAGEHQLHGVHERNGKLFGYVSKDDLFFVSGQGWQGYTAVERKVEYKSNPSKHECDARCRNATGLVMKCECSCGGKNHGRGSSIICEAA